MSGAAPPTYRSSAALDACSGVAGRVAIGLSGGIDSAVAAALLVERGHDVVGVHLRLWDGDDRYQEACGRARQVAHMLGIPLRVPDAREAFRLAVVDHFVAEYAAGRTPNPCIVCNPSIKFRFLLDGTLTGGATWAATGHYARVQRDGHRITLLRGADPAKDQSYFLYSLGQEQLEHVLFPLGNLTKQDVREIAHCRALPVAAAPESQDVCFIPGGDYRAFLRAVAPDLGRPGPIVDQVGHLLGEHAGLPAYTVGQRKGLGISADGPLYVLEIDPARNALVVGPAGALLRRTCLIQRLSFISGDAPAPAFTAGAQIRYGARPARARVTLISAASAHVRFDAPQSAIAPGQSVVIYDGMTVLGGGSIVSSS